MEESESTLTVQSQEKHKSRRVSYLALLLNEMSHQELVIRA